VQQSFLNKLAKKGAPTGAKTSVKNSRAVSRGNPTGVDYSRPNRDLLPALSNEGLKKKLARKFDEKRAA
jgi:hypothetical protein